MKRKKQIPELFLCLYVSAAILTGVTSAFAITKIPERFFAEKIYTAQLTYGSATSFDEFFDNLETLEKEFIVRKINWQSQDANIALPISRFSPSTNLKELRGQMEAFMEVAPVLTKVKVLLLGLELPYEIYLNESKIKEAFAGSGIEQGKANAYYSFDNASQTLGIVPEQIGIGINTAEISLEISAYFQDFDTPDNAALPLLTSTPEITQDLLEKYKDAAVELAKRQINLKDEKGQEWTVKMAEHMDWIFPSAERSESSIESREAGALAEPYFSIHPEPFISYIGNEISPEISVEASPVIITEHADSTITFEGSARNGEEINLEKLRTELEETFSGTGTVLDIPVDTIAPQITVPESLKAKGIKDLLGVGYSTLRGSPTNRIHNIKFGVSKFNGIIIAPQEEFSFTTTLGHVDAAHGWLPELVIKGDETIPEYGGGLCQVSTTMYRAALYSGLPITARRNHSYAVSYYAFPYGYGLDATVYEPWPDMKFVNDTAGSILVQSYVEGTDVYYVFYGTNDGRYMKMEGPNTYAYSSIAEPVIEYTDELEPGIRKLKDHSHTGFKVDWYRSVFNSDGTVRIDRELIHSEYEARPEKYLEGTADEAA